jgi:hypothetical protein
VFSDCRRTDVAADRFGLGEVKRECGACIGIDVDAGKNFKARLAEPFRKTARA